MRYRYKRWEFKDTNEVVDDLKFSPTGTHTAPSLQDTPCTQSGESYREGVVCAGRYLAVGSHDNNIYLYDVMLSFDAKRGAPMVKTGTCRGHSSFITHLDWSVSGDMIVSNSGDYEQLFWDIYGELVRTDVRDVDFATWT